MNSAQNHAILTSLMLQVWNCRLIFACLVIYNIKYNTTATEMNGGKIARKLLDIWFLCFEASFFIMFWINQQNCFQIAWGQGRLNRQSKPMHAHCRLLDWLWYSFTFVAFFPEQIYGGLTLDLMKKGFALAFIRFEIVFSEKLQLVLKVFFCPELYQ